MSFIAVSIPGPHFLYYFRSRPKKCAAIYFYIYAKFVFVGFRKGCSLHNWYKTRFGRLFSFAFVFRSFSFVFFVVWFPSRVALRVAWKMTVVARCIWFPIRVALRIAWRVALRVA